MSYDELMEVLVHRRSCRNFADTSVPDELVHKIIEAGLWCPSAHNNQDSIVVRIKDRAVREQLRKSTSLIMTNRENFDPFYGAPEILVVARRNGIRSDRDLGTMDGTLAMANMIIAAETLGLSTCWVNTAQINHMFTWSVLPGILKRVTGEKPTEPDRNLPFLGVGYLALGYRDGTADAPLPRKTNRTFEI